GDLADADAELVAHDLRERGLPEPRRPGEQHVVERLAARLRRFERNRELLLDALLPDEVAERARPKRALELLVGIRLNRREELRHAALRNAARTCSSTGSVSSTSASACSASINDHPRPTRASRASSSPPSAVVVSAEASFAFS